MNNLDLIYNPYVNKIKLVKIKYVLTSLEYYDKLLL